MSIFEEIMGQGGAQAAAMIAEKLGIDPAMAQQAVSALTQAHAEPGDTVQGAASATGLSADMLGSIMGQLGGEGGLGALVSAFGGTAGQAAGAAEGGFGGALGGLLGGLMGGNKG